MAEKLTGAMQFTLDMFRRNEFWSDGALWLNGPRKRHCRNMVKRGLLLRTEYPSSAGYRLTPAGRAVLTQTQDTHED